MKAAIPSSRSARVVLGWAVVCIDCGLAAGAGGRDLVASVWVAGRLEAGLAAGAGGRDLVASAWVAGRLDAGLAAGGSDPGENGWVARVVVAGAGRGNGKRGCVARIWADVICLGGAADSLWRWTGYGCCHESWWSCRCLYALATGDRLRLAVGAYRGGDRSLIDCWRLSVGYPLAASKRGAPGRYRAGECRRCRRLGGNERE